MKRTRIPLVISLLFVFGSPCHGQLDLIINEIMYAPENGKPEWVELYNRSGQSISLKDWVLHDATTARPIITTEEVLVHPGGYLIVSRDSSLLEDHPMLDTVLLVMMKFPTLNNSGDDVVLLRTDQSAADSIRYSASWGGQSGCSLERIDVDLAGSDSKNWTTSTDPSGSTPGRRNAGAMPEHDCAITRAVFEPAAARSGMSVVARITIRNLGKAPQDSLLLTMHEDLNRNGVADAQELIFSTRAISSLQPGDSLEIAGAIPGTEGIVRIFMTTLGTQPDERSSNNVRFDTVQFSLPPGAIAINEIMYAPKSGEPEWIELYNAGTTPVDLGRWSVGDNSTWHEISATAISPGDYLVLSGSADIVASHPDISGKFVVLSLPSLNNSGDEVRLRDANGALIDSVRYMPEWGGADGLSLERRNARAFPSLPDNWAESVDTNGGTPGRPNSNITLAQDLAATEIICDNGDITVTVRNMGFEASEPSRLELHHDMNANRIGEPLERIGDRPLLSLAPSDSFRARFASLALPPGFSRLLARVESAGDQRQRNDTARNFVVLPFPPAAFAVNEIMYEPLRDGAEWVEYVNTTARSLPIERCRIAGAAGSSGQQTGWSIAERPILLPPGGYLVIASDSAIFRQFPKLMSPSDDRVVVTLDRASLNLGNNGGTIVLIDPLDRTIDSIQYSPRWHHPGAVSTTGFSLERINPGLAAAEPTSWSTTCSPDGGTPGILNSVYCESHRATDIAHASLTATPNPFSPDRDGKDDLCILSWHIPVSTAEIRLRIYDSQGRIMRTLTEASRSGENGEIGWDGTGDGGMRLRVGVYIAVLDAVESNTGNVSQATAVVVVATQL
jgi:hypothetical protein